MPTFTVHQPRPRKSETESAPERFVFVRDGFHFWAFVVAPLWLLVHRLWLALFGYVVVTFVFNMALHWFGVPPTVKFIVSLLIALLVGFEAATLWRWTLTRRGWKSLGHVVAQDAELAERRFFTEWTGDADAPAADLPPATPQYSTAVRRGAPKPSDIIGLFPEPGGHPGSSR